MFPLLTQTFPSSAAELENLLNESLRQVLTTREKPVRVVGEKFPALQEIAIDLDRAQVRRDAPPPPRPVGETALALQVERFELKGSDVVVGPAAINLGLRADAVVLNQARDARNEIILTLQSARAGTVEVATARTDLENAITEFARREAGKQGVAIDDVRLNLRQVGERAVEGEASVRAKKMFFTTTIRLTARLEIDEQLNARVSNLNCAGEGAIGSLACGFLAPHLQKVNGRTFPLMTFAMGEVRLRDVRLSVGDKLEVRAEFGA